MTRWNPRGLEDNCGFCAISYALQQLGKPPQNADELYTEMMRRFGIVVAGNRDPVPRTLIFPKPDLDGSPWPVEYEELGARGISPSQYTIRSAASTFGLKLEGGDRDLVNALIEFAYGARPGWKLDDFVHHRMQRPGLAGKANFAAHKSHIERQLSGNWIIGSTDAKHYVNMSFTPAGEWKVIDAQSGATYDGRSLKARMGSLALFDRVVAA